MLPRIITSIGLLLASFLTPIALAETTDAQNIVSTNAELEGLWTARLRYGPDVHGPIVISRKNGAFVADVAGKLIPIQERNNQLEFSLPNDGGMFRGHTAERHKVLNGHWVQPNSNAGGGQRFATPTKLIRSGKDQWTGRITPLTDTITIFLSLSPGDNGTTKAFIRNPERNIGSVVRASRLERDGDFIKLIGNFGSDPKETVLAEGFYDTNNDQIILHFARFGATFTFDQAGSNTENAFYPRDREASKYTYSPPPLLNDGWKVGTLEETGIAGEPIAEFMQSLIAAPMDSLGALQIHGVLIARHGKLVLEEYFHGFDRYQPHDTRSAAKSITSVLVGAAMKQSKVFDEDSILVDSVNPSLLSSNIDARTQTIKVRDLLTMSSGFYCDDSNGSAPGNEDRMQGQRKEKDWWRYSLAVPMADSPGNKAVYCSMNPNLLGAVLNHKTQKWGPDLFRSLVAEPLHIKNYGLNLMPTGEAYLGGGMFLEPRDFLKFGQLVLNGGTWNNKRVLEKAYMDQATSPLKELNGVQYGYLWWSTDFPYKNRKVRAIYAGGNGGQVVMAIPELDLVVAFLGGNYGDPATFIPQRILVPEKILPAVTLSAR